MDVNNVSIVGMGKLGASMAASFALKGFDVIGVDVNQECVDLVNSGVPPVHETGLGDLFVKYRDRISATSDYERAVMGSDVTFVIVPTPSREDGAFSLEHAESAFNEIGRALAKKDAYHLVVLTSTVLPGSTRNSLLPILSQRSGKELGRDFGLCYSPEFIALGSIVRDFLNPDFTLIGELDDHSGSMLESIYLRLVENGARSARMSLENAELTKISVNTFVTTKITFANMLASICERLPGGDVDAVTRALGMDSRIGRKYMTGALGYGGPCFPRDNAALSFLAGSLGVSAQLAETTDQMNRSLAENWGRQIAADIPSRSSIAILGLSYKPLSQVTEESQGISLAHFLSNEGFRVFAYDPMVAEMVIEEHWKFRVVDSMSECLDLADTVIITNPDPVFATLSEKDFADRSEKRRIFDAWRILSPELRHSPRFEYRAIGLSEDSAESGEFSVHPETTMASVGA